jgi:hypothetical protein
MLGGLGAVVGARGAAATTERPDRFEYRGIPIWWAGWREPANQDVVFGWWIASVPRDDRGLDLLLSTVGGVVQRAAELHVVDCSIQRGWPHLMVRSSDAERAAAKQRAVENLLEHLRAS